MTYETCEETGKKTITIVEELSKETTTTESSSKAQETESVYDAETQRKIDECLGVSEDEEETEEHARSEGWRTVGSEDEDYVNSCKDARA